MTTPADIPSTGAAAPVADASSITDPTLFGNAVVTEIALIPKVFGLQLAFWAALVLAITWLARMAVAASVRVAWRFGLDRDHRMARIVPVARAIIGFVGAITVMRPVFNQLPVLTTLTTMVTALLASIALPGLVQSAAAGVSLAIRARYREGDQIEISGYRGGIRQLGIVRTQLRVEDGSMVWLPNSMLDREAVKVDRSTGAAPVRIRFEMRTSERDAVLDALRRAVMMLPFRRSGSLPRIQPATDDEREWTVEVQTWAVRELDIVRRSLRRTVDSVLATHRSQR